MRPNCRCRPAPKARVIIVLAVPGTPSSRIWPPTRRLVSMRSMTASWPTTALRTSPRTASVMVRISWTSIEHFPLPSVCVAREADQRCLVPPAGITYLTGPAPQGGAVTRDAARAAHALQPCDQRATSQCARRMQLAGDMPHGFLHISPDHHLLMTGKFDQLCHVLQEAGAPGAQ